MVFAVADGLSDIEELLKDGEAVRRPGPLGVLAGWLGATLAAERGRWGLWLPVVVGFGVALYFALPVEPPGWAGAAALAAALTLAVAARRRPVALLVLCGLGAVAAGFAAGQARTALVAAPMLEREIGPVAVTGRVLRVERQDDGARLVLGDLAIDRVPAERTPARVRVRLAAKHERPWPGATVRLRAVLYPPQGPAVPGAFDFQRHAFFDGLGAVGYALGPAAVIEAPAADDPWRRLTIAMEGAREWIATRVTAAVADPGVAGITTALLNGEQTGIPEPAIQAMRDSGLAHLLSISGLHIGLVAGLVFFALRAAMALAEPLALAFPIKKIAALGGIAAAVAYTLVVGAPVPTLRSLLMTGLALVAVLVDRDPFSMRLVAFAALVVLLVAPDSMLGPSFQMSFGAVVALIAAYETMTPVLARWRARTGTWLRALLYLAGIGLTSVVATLATTPFSLFHFQTLTFYGVIANMAAVPVTSFWVMPWGLIAYALMPLGLEEPALAAMAWGVGLILDTARFIAGLPGATALVPAMPAWGLAAVGLGGVWLCLWRQRWRALGLLPVLAGLASPALAPRPDVLVSADGALMAVRAADGGLLLSTLRAEKRTAATWLHRDGRAAASGRFPDRGVSADGRLACDALGCVYRGEGRTVALVRDPMALDEDCAAVAVVVTAAFTRRCPAPVVIDQRALRSGGAHALYLGGDGIRIDSVGAERGRRPWTGGGG